MAISQGNKKTIVFFWIFTLLGFCIVVAAYPENARLYLSFLWSRSFQFLILVALILAFCFLVIRWFFYLQLPQKAIKLIYGVVFLPLLLLPVLRCYFKVPYVFCRICPNKCPWGILRTFVFSAFFLLNISGKFWCTSLCPFGTFQECQIQMSKRNFKLPSWADLSAYLILCLTIAAYLLTLLAPLDAKAFFEIGRYEWATITVFAAILIFASAFFIPRFWCQYFCPVGTIAGLTLRFTGLFKASGGNRREFPKEKVE